APGVSELLASGPHRRLRAHVHRRARRVPPGARHGRAVSSRLHRRPRGAESPRRLAAVGAVRRVDTNLSLRTSMVDTKAPGPSPKPSALLTDGQKWTIVGLLSASITINLLHRQVLSVLAPELRNQFHWTNAQYGYIAVGFNLGMMIGQIP